MRADVILTQPIARSARVVQLESLFDIPPAESQNRAMTHELPLDDKPWHVGLIVGPSGAGKTTLARVAWPQQLVAHHEWSPDRAIVDDFPAALETSEVVKMLSGVGLGSPPAWLRPYRTLSTGEQFRADIAHALAAHAELLVVDEFTSTVDRQVAKVASHAISRYVRRDPERHLIALTCHFDIEEWLNPDWVYRPDVQTFVWRSLQPRPSIPAAIYPVDRAAWRLFRQHHYLSGDLATSAKCFGLYTLDDHDEPRECIAFYAVIRQPHRTARNIMRCTRIVIHPDWQGLGIAIKFHNAMGAYWHSRGQRLTGVTAHPAMIHAHASSPRWKEVAKPKSLQTGPGSGMASSNQKPRRLATRRFEYTHPDE